MFRVTEEGYIYVTRGDSLCISLTMSDDQNAPQSFQAGDKVRLKVFEKNNCARVMLQQDYPIESDSETVSLYLSGEQTAFGRLINTPTDYWYEIELNPDTEPRTIIGFDENGPKLFRLFPEGSMIQEGV